MFPLLYVALFKFAPKTGVFGTKKSDKVLNVGWVGLLNITYLIMIFFLNIDLGVFGENEIKRLRENINF